MKNMLIIGGTRNMGYFMTQRLLAEGHQVTLLNRGKTPDDLPEGIARLVVDRTNPQQMKRALLARKFDAVIDFALFRGNEAQTIVDLLRGQVGHYIFISSGQVYLVRQDIERPFREQDYNGRLNPAPKPSTYAFEEWTYGMEKRAAEDTFAQFADFPCTTLRLPMVNSERDHMRRLYQYILRLKDGAPLLVPETPDHLLRHVYGKDVVAAVLHLIMSGQGKNDAINISQDETVSLDAFLALLAQIMGLGSPDIVRLKHSALEASGFLPDCSPFSERWMSELDNTRSKQEFGITYTPLEQYLAAIVQYYHDNPPQSPMSYKRRHAEVQLANTHNDPSFPG